MPFTSEARLADVLPFVAAAGYEREAGAAAATSRETWTIVPPGLSPEDQRRVRRDGLLWQVLVKARYIKKLRNDTIDGGRTRLMWAASEGKLARVVELCDWGADVNAVSESGITALWEASCNGQLACVREFLARGAAVDLTDMLGASPLFVAAELGHVDCVRELLAHGAAVDTAAEDGATPLYVAAEKGHIDCMRKLLARGADVNKRAIGGWTPLMVASQNRETACVRILLEAGADKRLVSDLGSTAHALAGHIKPATTAAIRALLDAPP
jgi:ankyrin repeat protein